MPYVVHVDDNFHYMDPSERYTLGEFGSHAEAVAACRKIVDEFLAAAHKPGMKAEALFDSYVSFGEDPHFVPGADEPLFSAWDYARRRCVEICGGG